MTLIPVFQTIDCSNVRDFLPICPLEFRKRLFNGAINIPEYFNGVGIVDSQNNQPIGITFTLRQKDSDQEVLNAFNAQLLLPEGMPVLEQLLDRLLKQASQRKSRSVVVSLFESQKGNENCENNENNSCLRKLLAASGFENPKQYKINYKLNTLLFDPKKCTPLTPEELGSFRLVPFSAVGMVSDDQLPQHPKTMIPFITGYDSKISQFLLKNDKIVGWCSARRISPVSVFYSTIFVNTEGERAWGSPLLLRHIISQHHYNNYAPFAVFSTEVANKRFQQILEHQFSNFCTDIVYELLAVKILE
ncbi:MAG: hypothetical protein LBP87_03920 [Planctomycetaceae bacterium]|jgi:hypothetical protein|nr:hypothetical protein [Planctomycetaceae bacterium]